MMNKDVYISERSRQLIDYSKLSVGQTKYFDAEWSFKKIKRKIKFHIFDERPEMREVIRKYLHFELKTNSSSTVLRKYDGILFFMRYIENEHPEIKDFKGVNAIIINEYLHYVLKFKSVKGNGAYNEDGKVLSRESLKHNTLFLKRLFIEGHRSKWFEVPKELPLHVEHLYTSIIIKNPRMKNSPKTTKKEYKKETIYAVISCAYKDHDLYMRAGLFIQTQCGLRIEEVTTIRENGVRLVNGKHRLTYITTKTEGGKDVEVEVEKPINELCAFVIEELTDFTAPIREKLNTDLIFVTMRNQNLGIPRCRSEIRQDAKYKYEYVDKYNFNRNYVKPFLERWDIREDGKRIHLTTHYYRHFFAYLAWLDDMSMESIAYMLNHKSFVMTAVYTYNLRNEMREKFKQMMADPDNMVGTNVGNYKQKLSEKNPFKGKTEEQLDAIIGVMNIQVLANGACLHHPLKAENVLEKCKPGCLNCDRYVTHKCYLSVHKRRVDRLEDVMTSALETNKGAWYEKCRIEKQFIEQNYILPFIE